jgi:hypothetical protein
MQDLQSNQSIKVPYARSSIKSINQITDVGNQFTWLEGKGAV